MVGKEEGEKEGERGEKRKVEVQIEEGERKWNEGE